MTVAPVRRRPSAVVAAAPRLAARAQAERAARRVRWAKRGGQGLLALLPLLALGWVLLVSDLLAVDRVEVRGTSRLTVEQVRSAVPLEPDTPLARVDTGGIAEAVGQLPPVADVRVRRDWPGTLEVTVVERTVAAAVAGIGRVELVDADGVAFASEPSLPAGVVRLETEQPGPDDPATLAALEVHQALPAALARRVAALRASSPSSVELVVDGGRRVVWGAPGDTDSKAAAALALLRMPGTVVDVSAPGVVTRR